MVTAHNVKAEDTVFDSFFQFSGLRVKVRLSYPEKQYFMKTSCLTMRLTFYRITGLGGSLLSTEVQKYSSASYA
jgi:hypothetical protein